MLMIMKHGLGGVVPTLNRIDNNGDSFATVLIMMEKGEPVIMRNREGCAGGGKGPMYSDKSFTLATANDQILITNETNGEDMPMVFSHTQGLDAQPSEENSPTLRAGGAGMAVAYDEYNDSIDDIHHTLRAGTKQSTGVLTSTVRRLTPVECERLQGFPDNWTDRQADSHRYKQMGNAVAVPVVEWIIGRLVNAVESTEDKVEQ